MTEIKKAFAFVDLVAFTPDPEKVVSCAAKLCYSNATPSQILDEIDTDKPKDIKKYIDRIISYGHLSPLEHASFTFAISNMTRSCMAQLTRHRIASFSIQSQRYIDFSNFAVGTPQYVEYPFHEYEKIDLSIGQAAIQKDIDTDFRNAMMQSRHYYKQLREKIIFMLLCQYICDHCEEMFEENEELRSEKPEFKSLVLKKQWFVDCAQIAVDKDDKEGAEFRDLDAESKNAFLLDIFMDDKDFLKAYNQYGKIANENARCVLPNACTCNAIVTMNARQLLHFFNLRCCNRAQQEIRLIAWQMLSLVRDIAPNIFANAGPSCVRGACSEGKMTCGNPYLPNNPESKATVRKFSELKEEIFKQRPEVKAEYDALQEESDKMRDDIIYLNKLLEEDPEKYAEEYERIYGEKPEDYPNR